MGITHNNLRNTETAIHYYEKTLEIRKNVLGELHPEVAKALNNIASCYFSNKSYEKSE